MRLLLDTHLLLWAAAGSRKLPREARRLVESRTNEIAYSTASFWEIVVKLTLRRSDFEVDPIELLAALEEIGFTEVPVRSAHALELRTLPELHKDPFDRMLVAQSRVEGMVLLTSDTALRGYGPTVRVVG